MRIFLMADYPVGLEVVKFLKRKRENIVGLAIHPTRMENYINKGCTKKIIQTLNLPADKIFAGEKIQEKKNLKKIKELRPDLILTIIWGFLLKPELINIPSQGCINFHLSYLPYNRGKNPNIWSIIEGTPAGVTLHYINPGIDTGDIIAQTQVAVEPVDTGQTLYNKLAEKIVTLFKKTWPKIKAGNFKPIPQDEKKATFHYGKNLSQLDCIDLDKKYSGRELINILRARTFPPFPAAYFIENGKKVYIRVQLEYAKKPKK